MKLEKKYLIEYEYSSLESGEIRQSFLYDPKSKFFEIIDIVCREKNITLNIKSGIINKNEIFRIDKQIQSNFQTIH